LLREPRDVIEEEVSRDKSVSGLSVFGGTSPDAR
jgi:hypothetical protein